VIDLTYIRAFPIFFKLPFIPSLFLFFSNERTPDGNFLISRYDKHLNEGNRKTMKKLFVTILCLSILISCRSIASSRVDYNPNPQNVKYPTMTMKKIIEQQPPAYAYMPNSVEVDDQCIKLFMAWDLSGIAPQSARTEYICYRNVGKISLSHNAYDKVWIVKIDDVRGKYMYWVYAYERNDAEQFIDAISNYIKAQAK